MANNDRLITPEGYAEIEREIEHLETEGRREIAERIKVAREFGDISENAEYDDAKNDQALLEARIAKLRDRLQRAEVVKAKDNGKVVSIGSKVKFTDGKKEQTVTIVGHGEADPANGRLSAASPIGEALMEAKAGDEVSVKVPSGQKKLKVLKVG